MPRWWTTWPASLNVRMSISSKLEPLARRRKRTPGAELRSGDAEMDSDCVTFGDHPEQLLVIVGHRRPSAFNHAANRVAPHPQRRVRAVIGDVVGRIQLVDHVELPAVPDLVEQSVDNGLVAFGVHLASSRSQLLTLFR